MSGPLRRWCWREWGRPSGVAPSLRHRVSDRRGHGASTTDERRALTDHVTQHKQGDGLFRAAGQADERQLASEVADVRPVT
jgi:hypothetical protein